MVGSQQLGRRQPQLARGQPDVPARALLPLHAGFLARLLES
jgi:hypothetical protein